MIPTTPAPAPAPAPAPERPQPSLSFQELRGLGLSIAGAEIVLHHVGTLELTAARAKAAFAGQNERCMQLEERLATVQKWALAATAGTQEHVRKAVYDAAHEPTTQNLSTAYKAIVRIAETVGAPLADLHELNPHEAAIIAADRANTAADDCMNYADDLEEILRKCYVFEGRGWTSHLEPAQHELLNGLIAEWQGQE
jgi:hypothetical protein